MIGIHDRGYDNGARTKQDARARVRYRNQQVPFLVCDCRPLYLVTFLSASYISVTEYGPCLLLVNDVKYSEVKRLSILAVKPQDIIR